MIPLYEVRGAGKTYPGSPTPALHPVDLTVAAHRHLGIIGESGSGKTTLARLMLGLSAPTTGEVLYRGSVVPRGTARSGRPFRRQVQVVLQDPFSSLDPRMSIGRIIAEPVRALRPAWDARARVAELLDAVGLPESLASRLPRELSGGQRQRVAIARALAPRPELIIADEPVSALDVSVREQVLDLLDDIVAREELTLLVISHDLGVVHRLCAETLVMSRGRIVESGRTSEILGNPRHPYTQELVRSIPLLPATPDRSLHP